MQRAIAAAGCFMPKKRQRKSKGEKAFCVCIQVWHVRPGYSEMQLPVQGDPSV